MNNGEGVTLERILDTINKIETNMIKGLKTKVGKGMK